jgi:hypothetical protein
MERVHLLHLSENHINDPPPPYTLRPTSEVTKLQAFRNAVKEHFVGGPKTYEERFQMQEDEHVRALYEFVYLNQDAFDLEPNVYSEPCVNIAEIRSKFGKYPPRCRIACCTNALLKTKVSLFDETFASSRISRYKEEWLYACEGAPPLPSKAYVIPEFWDEEAQTDIRFTKEYENSLSPGRGWRSAYLGHTLIPKSGSPRHDVYLRSFLVLFFLTIPVVQAARFKYFG